MTTININDFDGIESSLEIIDANGGGGGDWDDDVTEDMEIERWSFERFPGADKIGTCTSKKAAHKGIHQRVEACGESFVPDPGNMYLSRPGVGSYESDVETVAGLLAYPRSIFGGVMLLGNPGTGKTALAQAACTFADREYVMLTATPDDTKDSLRIKFVGEGKGEGGTPYIKASLARAAVLGHTVIVDEFMLYVDGVKPTFYPLLDGSAVFPEANVDGTDLLIHPDFRIIVTSNPQVRGASLPEPIGSRFAAATLTVETSAALLHDLGVDESIIATWEALGSQNLWRPEIRELRRADLLLTEGFKEQAQAAFLPEHCPESQRVDVRNIVVSYLGADMRNDGRLVVS